MIFRANEVPTGYSRPQVQGPNASGINVQLIFFHYERNNPNFYKGYGKRWKDALAEVFYKGEQSKFIYKPHYGTAPFRHINVMPYNLDQFAPEHLSKLKWLNPEYLTEPPWGESKVYANDEFVKLHNNEKLPGKILMDSKNGNWLAVCETYSIFIEEVYNVVQEEGEWLKRAVNTGLIERIVASIISDEIWNRILELNKNRFDDKPIRPAFLDPRFARFVARVYEREEPNFRQVRHSSLW